jgi:thymidine kinase
MFAGKTTALLARIAAVRAAGRRALVVKPARDTRYDPGALATHDGRREPAVPVRALAEVRAGPGDAVFVDEVHFFGSDAVPPIEALLAAGADVTVAGCDIDHFGGAFAPFDALLPRASVVTRIAGTCARCGAPPRASGSWSAGSATSWPPAPRASGRWRAEGYAPARRNRAWARLATAPPISRTCRRTSARARS